MHGAGAGGEPEEHVIEATRGAVMPQEAWSKKRERQYEHIKDSYEERGVGEQPAGGETDEEPRAGTTRSG